MAVAMSALSLGLPSIAENTFRAVEKPTCIVPILNATSGFGANKSFLIFRKGR